MASAADRRAAEDRPFYVWRGQGSGIELDPVDVLAPVAEELVEVRLRDGGVVRSTDLGEPRLPRLWRERVGGEEGEGVLGG